jgi:hypothetical protein
MPGDPQQTSFQSIGCEQLDHGPIAIFPVPGIRMEMLSGRNFRHAKHRR